MITDTLCHSYKRELLEGIHQPGDNYKIALFTSLATLDASTKVYSAANEVKGAGYAAGGQALRDMKINLTGGTAWIDWADPVWAEASITARGALIYNATRGNRALKVLDFGADITSTNAPFTVQMPKEDAANAIIRIN